MLDAPVTGSLSLMPQHPLFGAAVEGLDLSAPLADAQLAEIRAALRRHLVLVFRRQALDPAALLAFTARLGAPQRHPLAGLALPTLPEVVVEAQDGDDRDLHWHADLTWTEAPSRVSALAACDAVDGRVTEFANQVAAWQRLNPWLRDRIEFLEVEHAHPRGAAAGLGPTIHPLVRVDPETGQRALLLDAGTARRVIGVPKAESEDLLHRLLAAATHPAIVLRHAWQDGDVVLWDNRAVLHRARITRPHSGRLLRAMVRGARPLGPAALAMAWVSAG